MNLCKYGCGKEGLFALKGFYSKGQYRCAPSANSCPEVKKKNKEAQPYNDPHKKALVVRKIHRTTEANLGSDWRKKVGARAKQARLERDPNTYQVAAKTLAETNLKRYGVKSVTQLEHFRKKVEATNLSRYGAPSQFHRRDIYERRRQRIHQEQIALIKSLHPNLLFDGSKTDRKLYDRLCRKFTALTKRAVGIVTPRGCHLDHRFSVSAGYHCKVPPEVLAHPINLEVLPASVNLSKHDDCSISLEDLMEQWHQNRPNWLMI